MACLGGTVEDPRWWFRYRGDGTFEKIDGRWCARTKSWTSREFCTPCPAFRGIKRDGRVGNGLAPNDAPYGLSADEHERYQHAMEEVLIEDNFIPLGIFLDRQVREIVVVNGKRSVVSGVGLRGRRRMGEPIALEIEAARVAGFRKAHPEYVKADREKARARMQKLRQARKARAKAVRTAPLS